MTPCRGTLPFACGASSRPEPGVIETEVHDEQDRLVAKTTQTQAVLRA